MSKCAGISFLITLLALNSFVVPAQPMPSKETQIKAVFLYNFAQFAQWPDEKFDGPSSPIIIGILGRDPFGTFLDGVVRGEEIDGRPVEIRRFTDPAEAFECHILFISQPLADHVETIENLKGKNIVTVSDADDFTRDGGMIRFFVDHNRMRFEVNMTEYKNNELVLSSRLLRLAQICCE